MQNVLILCGSANRGGVTERMCNASADYLKDCDCRIVYVDGIDHCTDCRGCESGRCVNRDAMDDVYRLFAGSDLLILSTPIHFSGPSSAIKTMLDRFQPYWFHPGMPHPPKVIGLMCGGSPEPSFGPTVSIFRAFSAMLGMEWLGHLEVSGTDMTGGEGVESSVQEFLSSKGL